MQVLIIFLIIGLAIACGVLYYQNQKQSLRIQELEFRMSRLARGSDGDSLEQALYQILDSHDQLVGPIERNSQDIDELFARLRPVIQKTGVVKYDAFQQMGGNLSSAIALLDESDNGFIINTVQNVNGCYSYVKEVINGGADSDLSKEEEDALRMARDNYSQIMSGLR